MTINARYLSVNPKKLSTPAVEKGEVSMHSKYLHIAATKNGSENAEKRMAKKISQAVISEFEKELNK
jgi:hypothetical protein